MFVCFPAGAPLHRHHPLPYLPQFVLVDGTLAEGRGEVRVGKVQNPWDELSRCQDVMEFRVKLAATVADILAFNERYRGARYTMTPRFGQQYAQDVVNWLTMSNLKVLEEDNISAMLDGFNLR